MAIFITFERRRRWIDTSTSRSFNDSNINRDNINNYNNNDNSDDLIKCSFSACLKMRSELYMQVEVVESLVTLIVKKLVLRKSKNVNWKMKGRRGEDGKRVLK